MAGWGKITGLHLIYYRVPGIDSGIRFFQDVLGLPVGYIDEAERDWAEFDLGGVKLAVAWYAEEARRPDAAVVLRCTGIEELMEDMKTKGVRFAGPIRSRPSGRRVGFYDFEGNYLELFEPRST